MTTENLPTLNWKDNKVIDTIKRTVAKDADDIELSMFIEFCKGADLNPFKKEAWFIKTSRGPQIMTGLNGYLKIANKHQQFDGMELDFEETEKGFTKAVCKVHRKDRKYPSVGIALMREFYKDTPIWKTMPSVMLGKVAKCIAIREAFPLETSGTYTEEEMPPEFAASKISAKTIDVKPADETPLPALFCYNLEEIPEDKREAARAWAITQGARKDSATGVYMSRKRLARLDKYCIDADAPDTNDINLGDDNYENA